MPEKIVEMEKLAASNEELFADIGAIFLGMNGKACQGAGDGGRRIGLKNKIEGMTCCLSKRSQGGNPAMNGGMDHLPFVKGLIGRGIAEGQISDQGTVGNEILIEITAGESDHGGEGIMLVRNGKIRIIGKFFIAGGTLPPGDKTENGLNELINDELKTPWASFMAFKPSG